MDTAKEEKKEQIMQAAFDTIKKYGIKRVTLEDIAHASGMATTSIYYYFPSKNVLIKAAISQFMNNVMDQIITVVKSGQSPEQKLVSCWEIIFSSIRQSGFLLDIDRKTMTQMTALAEELINDFETRYQKLIRKILLEGIKTGAFQVDDVELWASILSVGVTNIIENEKTRKPVMKDRNYVAKISKIILSGLLRR